jgi:hypothetical protein
MARFTVLCTRCSKEVIDALDFKWEGEVMCRSCREALAGAKSPTKARKKEISEARSPQKLEEAICENCGTIITGKAKANLVNDKIVCTPCWKTLAGHSSPTRPATEKQLRFLRDLGFRQVDGYSFDKAHWTLDHAQELRYFAFQVARQEWKQDLKGFDLRPMIHAAFADPAMLEEIYALMRRREELAYARQRELNNAQLARMDSKGRIRDASGKFVTPESVPIWDCAPDLEKDLNYCMVRDSLLAILGPETLRPPSLLRRLFGG